MHTYDEIERAAYLSGDLIRAELAHEASKYFDAIENTGFTLDSTVDAQVDAEVTARCPNYAEYKQFFEECFYRLNGHYPCPSVTSDYDQSVIFDAIEKGSAE